MLRVISQQSIPDISLQPLYAKVLASFVSSIDTSKKRTRRRTLMSATARAIHTGTPRQSAIAAGFQRRRTVVVDDSPVFLEAACALLELKQDIEIVGIAANGVNAIEVVASLRPELVLMDIDMPYLDGLNAALLLSTRFPDVSIVLMSAEDSAELRADCQACGAVAFVHKLYFLEHFSRALESVDGFEPAPSELIDAKHKS
jgi:CheY-like chemotaxis protein